MDYVTCMGHRYGLVQVWVWVGKFPPTRNPYLWGRFDRLVQVFFHLIAILCCPHCLQLLQSLTVTNPCAMIHAHPSPHAVAIWTNCYHCIQLKVFLQWIAHSHYYTVLPPCGSFFINILHCLSCLLPIPSLLITSSTCHKLSLLHKGGYRWRVGDCHYTSQFSPFPHSWAVIFQTWAPLSLCSYYTLALVSTKLHYSLFVFLSFP